MARAVRIDSYGGPEVLQIVQIDDAVAPANGVVIELRAIGVNPVDWKIRSGAGRPPLDGPIGLGSDAAGVITSIGVDESTFRVGDAVIARGLSGAYASSVAAASSLLTLKPEALGFEQAAGIGIPVGTAYQVLKSIGASSGETVLIHAGSGAVGQAAIQLARHWELTVIATASERNHPRLVELGAIPVLYGDGLLERIKAVAPQGVDLVLDAAGTNEAIDSSLALVSDRDRIATITAYDRAAAEGIRAFSGSRPGLLNDAEKALRAEAVGYVADLATQGLFEIEVGAVYPLDQVAEAHRRSEAGDIRGKIVLVP